MNCPNCGNEIKENQKFCTSCGTKINGTENINSNTELYQGNKVEKNKIIVIISLIIILAFSFLLIAFKINDNKRKAELTAIQSQITLIQESQFNDKSSKELLELLVEQDNNLFKLTKLNNFDDIFEIFYRNLLNASNFIYGDNLNLTENPKYNYWSTSTNPETDLYEFQVNNISVTRINEKYLKERYSQYLSKEWQEYLELSTKDRVETEASSGLSTGKSTIINWIIEWQKFLSQHPNFKLNDKIKEEIKYLTTEILYHEYSFAYTDDGSMAKDSRKGYEEFLNKVDKNTAEYKVVKACYDELKKNKFKATTEFFRLLSEYSKYDWHKELYQSNVKQDQFDNDVSLLETKEKWKKVAEHLYFDVNSFEGNSGTFKIYYTPNNAPNYFDTIPALGIEKVFCDCEKGYMYINQTEYFDKNNKYINGDYPRAFADISYKEHENGEIYFSTLCSQN